MESLAWTAKNVVATLVLPPASLLILIALGLWFSRRPWGRWLGGASLALLTLLSIPAIGTMLKTPVERAYPPLDSEAMQQHPRENTIVVILGGGRDLGGIEYPEGERLNNASLRRARYGARIARHLGLPIAVSGGRPEGGSYSEALLMKRFIESELFSTVSLIEEKSRNTRENARYLAKVLTIQRIDQVILVTDVMHMPRASSEFRAAGLRVIPAPLYFHADAPLSATEYLPRFDGLETSGRVLYEIIGGLWYSTGAN